eukprot:254868-Amphidinium_carterae.1
MWEATLQDVTERSTIGPFHSELEASTFLKCDDWIPTERIPVVQRSKVRGVDSATVNDVNKTVVSTEKLELPSVDTVA